MSTRGVRQRARQVRVGYAMDDHATALIRKWKDQITAFVPGFSGYETSPDKGFAETSQWLVEQLDHAKAPIDEVTRQLADAGDLASLPAWDRLRHDLDLLSARLRGMTEKYHGFGDRFDDTAVGDLYGCDADLMSQADQLVEIMRAPMPDLEKARTDLAHMIELVDRREERVRG